MLFDNSFSSAYEEIKTWNPVWYRKVHDMDALWQVYGSQLDKIQENLIQLVNNNFIDFADEVTVIRLEEFLSIKHHFPRTLVERRNIIKGFIIGQGHIGRKTIIELISIFTNGEINVAFSNGVITIYVTKKIGEMFNLSDIRLIIGNRIPAHLALGIVDYPSPVKVINKNNFSFFNLLMFKFSIANKTSIIIGSRLNGEKLLDCKWLLTVTNHGINFHNFLVKVKLKNYGEVYHGINLNGRVQLEGLYMLNGETKSILSGIVSRKLKIKGLKFYNQINIKSQINYQLTLNNTQDFMVNNLCVHGRFINRKIFEYGERSNGGLQKLFNGLSVQQLDMGVYKFKNQNYLSAILIREGSWYMDGKFTLNGINTIDKYIIKEAI